MSQLRDFFVKLPAACGVDPELAEIEGEANGKRFDLEVRNPNSVFRHQLGKTTRHRMIPAWIAWSEFSKGYELDYAIDLMCYAADCYGIAKAGLEPTESMKDTRARLEFAESEHPAVKALMTVEYASTLSNWA